MASGTFRLLADVNTTMSADSRTADLEEGDIVRYLRTTPHPDWSFGLVNGIFATHLSNDPEAFTQLKMLAHARAIGDSSILPEQYLSFKTGDMIVLVHDASDWRILSHDGQFSEPIGIRRGHSGFICDMDARKLVTSWVDGGVECFLGSWRWTYGAYIPG